MNKIKAIGNSQKSAMVEFESNVIQRARLNQIDCQNLRAAQEYHSLKEKCSTSFLFVKKETSEGSENKKPFTYDI